MPELDYDKAAMLACQLKYGRTLLADESIGATTVTMSVRTFQRIIKAKIAAPSNRPGRAGYTDERKHKLLLDYNKGNTNINGLARRHNVCHATAKRWVTNIIK